MVRILQHFQQAKHLTVMSIFKHTKDVSFSSQTCTPSCASQCHAVQPISICWLNSPSVSNIMPIFLPHFTSIGDCIMNTQNTAILLTNTTTSSLKNKSNTYNNSNIMAVTSRSLELLVEPIRRHLACEKPRNIRGSFAKFV